MLWYLVAVIVKNEHLNLYINMSAFIWHWNWFLFNISLLDRQVLLYKAFPSIHLLIFCSTVALPSSFESTESAEVFCLSPQDIFYLPLHCFKDSVNIPFQPEGSWILTPCHLLSLFPLAGWHGWTVGSAITPSPLQSHINVKLGLQHTFHLFLPCFYFKPGLRAELQRMLFFLIHRGKGSGCQATRDIRTFFWKFLPPTQIFSNLEA